MTLPPDPNATVTIDAPTGVVVVLTANMLDYNPWKCGHCGGKMSDGHIYSVAKNKMFCSDDCLRRFNTQGRGTYTVSKV